MIVALEKNGAKLFAKSPAHALFWPFVAARVGVGQTERSMQLNGGSKAHALPTFPVLQQSTKVLEQYGWVSTPGRVALSKVESGAAVDGRSRFEI